MGASSSVSFDSYAPFLDRARHKIRKWAAQIRESQEAGNSEVDERYAPMTVAINDLGFLTNNSQSGATNTNETDIHGEIIRNKQGHPSVAFEAQRAYITGFVPYPLFVHLANAYKKVVKLAAVPPDIMMLAPVMMSEEQKRQIYGSRLYRIPVTIERLTSKVDQSTEFRIFSTMPIFTSVEHIKFSLNDVLGRGQVEEAMRQNLPFGELFFIDMRWGHDSLLPDGLLPFVKSVFQHAHQLLQEESIAARVAKRRRME